MMVALSYFHLERGSVGAAGPASFGSTRETFVISRRIRHETCCKHGK
jgi:hypothetical protein